MAEDTLDLDAIEARANRVSDDLLCGWITFPAAMMQSLFSDAKVLLAEVRRLLALCEDRKLALEASTRVEQQLRADVEALKLDSYRSRHQRDQAARVRDENADNLLIVEADRDRLRAELNDLRGATGSDDARLGVYHRAAEVRAQQRLLLLENSRLAQQLIEAREERDGARDALIKVMTDKLVLARRTDNVLTTLRGISDSWERNQGVDNLGRVVDRMIAVLEGKDADG